MIEHDLFTSLSEVTPNVYALMMPEDAELPSITYQVVYDGANQATNGNFMSRDVRFQVDIYAKSYFEAKTLKEEVVAKIIELKGGSISAQDLYEDDIKLNRQLVDFKIKRT